MAEEALQVAQATLKVAVHDLGIHLEVSVDQDVPEARHSLDRRCEVRGEDPLLAKSLEDFLVVARTGQSRIDQHVESGIEDALDGRLERVTDSRLHLTIAQ